AETITRTFASDSDYDGVELVYMDPDTEAQETIRLPLDGSATKYKRVEVSGIRSYAQAWFRANREYQRLRYQRKTIETVVTGDAANKVLMAAPPAEALVTEPTPEEGIRTAFSFASDAAHQAKAWLLQKITPTSGGYYQMTAISYASEYYDADAAAIPARDTVIN